MNDAHPSEIDAFDAWESRPLSERARPAPPYLSGLNPAQREAVEALDGPVLVLAGAGTGKTRALTTRLAHLIHQQRAFPSQILAVTFTNKAAREMKERIGALLGNAVEGMPWLGTFHSICVKILRRHAELVELKPNFTILDSDDQLRLIRQLLDAEGIDDKRWPARMFASLLDRWKNRAQGPAQVPADETGFAGGRGAELYGMYQARLRTLNAVDFGDLLLHVVSIFQHHPEILADYQRRFRYILVDEYQDTNVAQYLWLRLLAAQHRNICCVGDDDQSIYGWRGAEVGNILRFERDFPGARVIRLEQNYRSTPHILAAASGVIAANRERLGKTLWTDAEGGERVRLIGHWDGEEEARWIGEEIEALTRGTRGHGPLSLDDIAILVRASFQMRAFEDRFLTTGLPYRVIGGPRFYERMEIRDAMAYFRVVVSPDDGLAFERIVNTPKRGIGDKAILRLNQLARENGVSLVEAARLAAQGGEGITRKGAAALGQLVTQIDRWGEMLRGTELSHVELAGIILDESGYTGMWQADRSAEAPGRVPGGLPARLGRRALSLAAVDGRERSQGSRGGTPPRLCRADARAPPPDDQLRREPPYLWPLAVRAALALHRRAPARDGRGADAAGPLWRRLWRGGRAGHGRIDARTRGGRGLDLQLSRLEADGRAPCHRRRGAGPRHARVGRRCNRRGALRDRHARLPPEIRLWPHHRHRG